MPRVLIVLRSTGNRKAIRTVLGRAGYHVTDAATLDDVTRHVSDPDTRPGAALVDLTGFRDEAWPMCDALQRASVPFLVVSPGPPPGPGKALAAGAATVLQKPIVKASLLDLLDGLLAR